MLSGGRRSTGFRTSPVPSAGAMSIGSWPVSTAELKRADATTRSCSCWSPTACEAGRSPRSPSMTSTGSASVWRSPSARLATRRRFPCLPWSARRSGLPPARTSRDHGSAPVLPGRGSPPADRGCRGVLAGPPLPAQGGRRRSPAGLAHAAPFGGAAPRRCELRSEDHRRLRRAPLGTLDRGLREGRRRDAAPGRAGRRRSGAGMNDSLATAVVDFLAHKRALGRKYQTEEATLRLLLTFAAQHAVEDLRQLTPGLLDEFIASRPRQRARSFNHLVGILGCFLDWSVTQQRLEASPLRRTRRRETAQRLPFLFDTARDRKSVV